MNRVRPLLGRLMVLASLAACSLALAQAPDRKTTPGTEYSKNGADTCLNCHGEDAETYAWEAIFHTKHAQRGNPRAPFGKGALQCEACHGPGANHASRGSKKKLTINSFKSDSFLSVAERNQPCLACHENGPRTAWHASAHADNDVACADCHQMHKKAGDPMLAKARESEVCLSCHQSQRADFHKTSSHPVLLGKMSCSDCHSPHGSSAPAMLAKATLNQTCYSCHADKRGPLLWEHAPVTEDCSLCHTPHGSVRSALLVKTAPLLCQQCHSAAGHPSVARTSAGLPGGTAGGTAFIVAGSCMNCHTQVHGSNHPSGAKLMR